MSRPKIIRKRGLESLKDEEKWDILRNYRLGKSLEVLSTDYKISQDKLESWISKECKGIIASYETRAISKSSSVGDKIRSVATDPQYVNQEFLKHLSGSHESLSDKEQLYCFLYVENGCDNLVALEGSGLHEGLSPKATGYKNLCHLRGQYLREKPNVKSEIRELRSQRYSNLTMNKEALQSEVLDVITQLKVKGNSHSQILKAIELLGRLDNLFNTNINVSEVKPEDEYNKLLEMVKKDEAYQVTEAQSD